MGIFSDIAYLESLVLLSLEPSLHLHMKNVYACVALSKLAGSVGSFVHLFTGALSGGFISLFLGLGCMITLMSASDDDKNIKTRLFYLSTSAFLFGLGIGPLLESVIAIDHAIIFTAFFGSFLIFSSFTLASLISNDCKNIYLGGTLMSLLSCMMLMSYFDNFIETYLIFKALIYIGSVVTCACILHDTQVIMEKRRNKDKEFIWHSICMFVHFFYFLVSLTDKESNKKKI